MKRNTLGNYAGKKIKILTFFTMIFLLALSLTASAATIYGEGSKVPFGNHNISVIYGTWEIDASAKTIISKTYSSQQISDNPDIKNAMLLFDKYENYTLTFDLEVPLGPIGNCYTNIILNQSIKEGSYV